MRAGSGGATRIARVLPSLFLLPLRMAPGVSRLSDGLCRHEQAADPCQATHENDPADGANGQHNFKHAHELDDIAGIGRQPIKLARGRVRVDQGG
jgi:hypothetical protein